MKTKSDELSVAWIEETETSSYIFKVIRSSSLGTTCHRDEYLFIRYKDGCRMMINRGRLKRIYIRKGESMMTNKGRMMMTRKSMI